MLFALFVVFIAYRILTPPSRESEPIASPDGSREARLRVVRFYDDHLTYKIQCRTAGKPAWIGLGQLVTNEHLFAETELRWSENSERLNLLFDGTSVWDHAFSR